MHTSLSHSHPLNQPHARTLAPTRVTNHCLIRGLTVTLDALAQLGYRPPGGWMLACEAPHAHPHSHSTNHPLSQPAPPLTLVLYPKPC